MNEPVVGIDLGTTNTVVAALGEGGAEVLRDERGSALLPSAVALDEGGLLLVGAAAAERLAKNFNHIASRRSQRPALCLLRLRRASPAISPCDMDPRTDRARPPVGAGVEGRRA